MRTLPERNIIGNCSQHHARDVIARELNRCHSWRSLLGTMMQRFAAVLIVALTATAMLFADANARQARRRDRQQQTAAELDTAGLTPDALRKLYLGTWNDQGRRFWFSIDKIAGAQVQEATFRMAHLQNGRIDGNRLTLVSGSCVPVIGCYSYTLKGTLLAQSRMDIHGTDETGETVHFVLVRK
jgi:hypothetical protein